MINDYTWWENHVLQSLVQRSRHHGKIQPPEIEEAMYGCVLDFESPN